MRSLSRRLILAGLLIASSALHAEQPVRLFAAASLSNALTDIAAQWQRSGHVAPSLAFSASSTLAKQIEAGAPVDLFASADLTWMDYLDTRGKIDSGSRRQSAGQRAGADRARGQALRGTDEARL